MGGGSAAGIRRSSPPCLCAAGCSWPSARTFASPSHHRRVLSSVLIPRPSHKHALEPREEGRDVDRVQGQLLVPAEQRPDRLPGPAVPQFDGEVNGFGTGELDGLDLGPGHHFALCLTGQPQLAAPCMCSRQAHAQYAPYFFATIITNNENLVFSLLSIGRQVDPIVAQSDCPVTLACRHAGDTTPLSLHSSQSACQRGTGGGLDPGRRVAAHPPPPIEIGETAAETEGGTESGTGRPGTGTAPRHLAGLGTMAGGSEIGRTEGIAATGADAAPQHAGGAVTTNVPMTGA